MKLLKGFAALSAAVLLCSAGMIPAAAADTPQYQKGDVNMDGTVDVKDAVLVAESYCGWIVGKDHFLTEEQMVLADVADTEPLFYLGRETNITIQDASDLLCYALLHDVGYEEVTFNNMQEYLCYVF